MEVKQIEKKKKRIKQNLITLSGMGFRIFDELPSADQLMQNSQSSRTIPFLKTNVHTIY